MRVLRLGRIETVLVDLSERDEELTMWCPFCNRGIKEWRCDCPRTEWQEMNMNHVRSELQPVMWLLTCDGNGRPFFAEFLEHEYCSFHAAEHHLAPDRNEGPIAPVKFVDAMSVKIEKPESWFDDPNWNNIFAEKILASQDLRLPTSIKFLHPFKNSTMISHRSKGLKKSILGVLHLKRDEISPFSGIVRHRFF